MLRSNGLKPNLTKITKSVVRVTYDFMLKSPSQNFERALNGDVVPDYDNAAKQRTPSKSVLISEQQDLGLDLNLEQRHILALFTKRSRNIV